MDENISSRFQRWDIFKLISRRKGENSLRIKVASSKREEKRKRRKKQKETELHSLKVKTPTNWEIILHFYAGIMSPRQLRSRGGWYTRWNAQSDMKSGEEREKGRKSDERRDSANRLESQQSYRTTVKGSLPMGGDERSFAKRSRIILWMEETGATAGGRKITGWSRAREIRNYLKDTWKRMLRKWRKVASRDDLASFNGEAILKGGFARARKNEGTMSRTSHCDKWKKFGNN